MYPTISSSKIKHFAGFTLVELIVVITILVILGTVAFTSLGGYSASARDSQRIENLANLKKGLDIFRIKTETYPLPENSISILSLGSTIGYQWFAKNQVASIAQISKGGTLDPSDASMYTTYSTNANRTKMQAMVFLEDGNNATVFTPTTYASISSDYTKRTPRVIGDTLGILLWNSGSTLNQPVQELYDAVSFTGVDIVTATGGIINAYISNTTIISGTGPVFIPLLTNYDSSIGTYPGCDTKDIKLPNGQVWAACNVGATVAWTNQTFASSTGARNTSINTWAGGLYQWGNNADVSYANNDFTPVDCSNIAPSQYNNAIFRAWSADWCISQSNNLWGNIPNINIAGQWPCVFGYHIPSQPEWSDAVDMITNNYSLWAGTETFFLQSILKLPMAGRRLFSSGALNTEGTTGNYWSSMMGFYLVFNNLAINHAGSTFGRATGMSIRCIRN